MLKAFKRWWHSNFVKGPVVEVVKITYADGSVVYAIDYIDPRLDIWQRFPTKYPVYKDALEKKEQLVRHFSISMVVKEEVV